MLVGTTDFSTEDMTFPEALVIFGDNMIGVNPDRIVHFPNEAQAIKLGEEIINTTSGVVKLFGNRKKRQYKETKRKRNERY